jgi:hypothetical protein
MDYDPDLPIHFNRDLPEGIAVGTPIAEFTFSPMRRFGRALLGLGVAAVGICLIALPWLGDMAKGQVKLTFLGLAATGIGGLLFFNALWQRARYAWLGTAGVALLEHENVESASWKEIQVLWDSKLESEASGVVAKAYALAQGKSRVVKAQCQDGRQLVFTAFFGNIGRLAKIMKQQTMGHLLPPILAALKAGETIQFGPLAVTDEGVLRRDGQMVAWPDVKSILNKDGHVHVTAAGKWLRWFSCPQGEIPNLHLLMAVTERYREPTGSE